MKPGDVLLDTYEVERVLGRGGMGVVVSALHRRLGERVAIKVLREERGEDQQPRIRLSREAQAAARLRGEHSVRVFDLRELPGGQPAIVMEFVDGGSLADLLHQRGPLPVEEALDYVLQAAEGLAEAHAAGIVHRDIKPANLMLTRRPDGSPLVKVSDFGLATVARLERITGSEVTLGSPPYMSPEQIRTPHEVDARSDVWSLAVVLHELCTGALPWAGYTSAGILASIAADAPIRARNQRPELPVLLDEVLLRALEKAPAARLPSVAALAAALAPLLPDGAARAARIERILLAAPRPAPGASTFASSPAPSTGDTPGVSTEAPGTSIEASVLPPAASLVEAHGEEGPLPQPPPPGGPRGSASSLQARKTPRVPSLSSPSPYRRGGRGVRPLRPWIALGLAIVPLSLGIWGLNRHREEGGAPVRAEELRSSRTLFGASSAASGGALAPLAVGSSPAGAPASAAAAPPASLASASAAVAPRVGGSGASAAPLASVSATPATHSASGKGVGRAAVPGVRHPDAAPGGGEAAARASEPAVDPLDQLGPRK